MIRNPLTGRLVKEGGATHRRLIRQTGGADIEQLRRWWQETEEAMGGDQQGDDVRDDFINDIVRIANGRPISYNEFILAHALWHGNGYVDPNIFGSDPATQVRILNETPDFTTEPIRTVEEFIDDYINQLNDEPAQAMFEDIYSL